MYIDETVAEVKNFEGLFDLTSPDGSDPPASSLFNLTTLRTLLRISEEVPDIIEAPELVTGVLNLSAYTNLTKEL